MQQIQIKKEEQCNEEIECAGGGPGPRIGEYRPRAGKAGGAGESYSPGLLRVVARFNAETSSRRASDLIFESMRLPVGPSRAGRKARAVGEQVQEWELSETAPLEPSQPVRGLAVDGTGIPAG